MKLTRSQHGMAALTGILVVILVAAIAGVGWYVYANNQANNTESGTVIDQVPVSNDEAPQIKKTADLDEASNALDDQNVDKNLDTTALDEDIDSLF